MLNLVSGLHPELGCRRKCQSDCPEVAEDAEGTEAAQSNLEVARNEGNANKMMGPIHNNKNGTDLLDRGIRLGEFSPNGRSFT
jgi:hypothetical protein